MSTLKIYVACNSNPNDDIQNLKNLAIDITPLTNGVTVLPALFGTWLDTRDNTIGIDDYSFLLTCEVSNLDTSLLDNPIKTFLKAESQYAALIAYDGLDPRLVCQDNI